MNTIPSARESVAPESFEVLIIGAGIVGAACAVELAGAGLAVGVLESDVVGSGATAAGMGHVTVMDDSPAQLALTRYSQRLWDAFAKEAPPSHEYARCGTIWVAEDEEEMRAVQLKHDYFATYDVPSSILDASALYAHEPNLRPGLAGGLRVPEDSVVYPPGSAALLMARAAKHGVRLLQGTVTQVMDGGVQLASGAEVRGDIVVLANGARAVDLAPELPIRPKKGHLAITDRYPGFLRHQLVELGYIKNAHATEGDSVAFNVQPRGTGQVLIGSSRQFDATSSAIDHGILSRMLDRAFAYLPALTQLSCNRVWTGFRAATPDGLPLIGPHADRKGLWLATGHEGLGITTSLGTAKLLAAQLLGRPAEIPFEPYLPSRNTQQAAHA
jgi:D-hydroxyproline dehydrogenase subunit beta